MVSFPVYVSDPEDPTWLVVIDSLEQAERGEIEEFDVLEESFIYWDSRGLRVRAEVERSRDHWLKLTETDTEDIAGLRETVARFAEAVGVPRAAIENMTPLEAVAYVRAEGERAGQERRRRRRWYQFWRRG